MPWSVGWDCRILFGFLKFLVCHNNVSNFFFVPEYHLMFFGYYPEKTQDVTINIIQYVRVRASKMRNGLLRKLAGSDGH
jgi:hypothetical protein